jgi:putative ABC transport system ATP-binding protein
LCDEPTGDLDRASGDEILDIIGKLSRDFGKTVFLVTHDPVAAERASTILHLDKGTLLEYAAGKPNASGPKDTPR